MVTPKLFDLPTTRTYRDGDRFVASVGCNLTNDQIRRLWRSVDKFLRIKSALLVVNVVQVKLAISRLGSPLIPLTTDSTSSDSPLPGVVNLEVNAVEFEPSDVLCAWTPYPRKEYERYLKSWAGDDTELKMFYGGE